jgi:hypothetical protein
MPELKLIRLTCRFFVQFAEGNARNTIDARNGGRQPVCATLRILLIARSVGRPIVETKETNRSFGMSLDTIILTDADKLEVLQRLDQFQKWNSLDDKRYCLWCSKIITGYEIQVIGGTRGTGPLRIICPTEGCHSIPMDWALPTDEALSKYRDLVA